MTNAHVVAVVNLKGGTGKTTTTIGLAHEAVTRGQHVLVIDIDGQRNASGWLTGTSRDDWYPLTVADVLDTNRGVGLHAHDAQVDRVERDLGEDAGQKRVDVAPHVQQAGDGAGELCVIGGAQVYALALPRATAMHLTHVDAAVADADTHFPPFDAGDWEIVSRAAHPADDRHAYAFEFVDYRRAAR